MMIVRPAKPCQELLDLGRLVRAEFRSERQESLAAEASAANEVEDEATAAAGPQGPTATL